MTSTRSHLLACVGAISIAATLVPGPADAQGRHAVGRVAPHGVVVAAYYRPLFYDPFFYDPWFAYPFGWYPPYAYPPYAYGPVYYNGAASLRLQVSPREAEVFIDNHYAGTVDSYDGVFQRLHLEPGEHEVTFYLSGYRTATQKILLQPGKTFRVRHLMEALPAGAPPEPRPAAAAPLPATEAAGRGAIPSQPPARAGNTAFGAIAIRVQPADADVLINGDRWEGPASDEALVVQLAPGRYDIEVRKDGYRPFATQVEVRSGETAPLNVSLPQQ